VYDSTSATAADIRARHVAKEIAAVTAKGGYCPTPEEIAERASEIREGWTDEDGVLQVSPRCGDRPEEYQPGIREVPGQGFAG